MVEASQLIRDRRLELGMSTRRLAALAGVAYPTVSRIENGHEIPRWSTMQRLTTALGLETSVTSDRPIVTMTLADVASEWSTSARWNDEPDWTSLRAFADQLTLRPEAANLAIQVRPPRTTSLLLDNCLAAMAEKIAHDCGFRPPRWTKDVPPLDTPWEAPGTPRMRAAARKSTPIEFARRRIFLDPVAIWRRNALTRA
jgi:transcriptional regulator with XRE-family HTH domain